jgi:hypothetical protein
LCLFFFFWFVGWWGGGGGGGGTGWDSHYLASVPVWEPLATCPDVMTNELTTCNPQRAWTPHAYGLELASISLGDRPAVEMPVDLNARLGNASDPSTASPFYALVMPEGSQLWLNAKANADALVAALASSGYVSFPASASNSDRAAFWRGERAILGAALTAAASGGGLVLTFAHGATATVDVHSLFATLPNEGLKQVGFSGSRGYRCASLALSPLPLILSYKSEKSWWGTGRAWSGSRPSSTTWCCSITQSGGLGSHRGGAAKVRPTSTFSLATHFPIQI